MIAKIRSFFTSCSLPMRKHLGPFANQCTIARLLMLGLILLFIFTSCATVPAYDRAYLNDEEMKLSQLNCAHFEAYFQIIREGASGADGGKTGGGCGCN
jgi:hypothetical protein